MSYAALYDSPAPAFIPRRRVLRGSRRRGVGGLTTQQLSAQVGSMVSSGLAFIPGVGPLAAAAASIATSLAVIIENLTGCGSTCTQATQYANQASAALDQVRATYFATPNRTVSFQQSTLAQIQQVFNALQQACSNPALGNAGKACISQRLVRGSSAPWCNTPDHTGCDWVTYYYDDIANDPNVSPDPVSAVSSVLTSVESGNFLPLALVAALVVGLVIAL
jgi:hypothetical protein